MIYTPKKYGLCSDASLHNIIEEKKNEGYYVIIIGCKNHLEFIESASYAGESCSTIENSDDIKRLNIKNDKILVVAQTTISGTLFDIISLKIKEKYNDREVYIINSSCNLQEEIKNSSLELAKKMDYMIVIGDNNNSNSKELFNLCSNVCKSFFINSETDLFILLKKENKLTKNSKIGITSDSFTSIKLMNRYIEIIKFYFEYCSFVKRIDKKMLNYNKKMVKVDDNALVRDAVYKFISLNSGGKYIRAFLINLGYMYRNKDGVYADSLGVSYETFQTSILVHDDIIDCATKRRGKSTIPTLYNDEFKNLSCSTDLKEHTADSLGICLADLGFYSSISYLTKTYSNNKYFSKVLSYYTDIVLNTIKGEIIDVYLPFKSRYVNSDVSLDDILEISKLKTSWYTIVGPFCLGLLLSGVNLKIVKQFEDALIPLGIAFQIKDDILGIYSDNQVLGKNSSDITDFKQTVLYYYAIKTSYKDELLKYYGKNNLNNDDINSVREIFNKSLSLDKSLSLMNSLFKEAKDSLLNIKMRREYRDIIFGFISYLENRKK